MKISSKNNISKELIKQRRGEMARQARDPGASMRGGALAPGKPQETDKDSAVWSGTRSHWLREMERRSLTNASVSFTHRSP